MSDYLTDIATQVVADLRTEGCTASIAVTAANRNKQPEWARQELAGRLYLKRDLIDRMPSEDHQSYEQAVNSIIARSDEALGLILARGKSGAAMVYRIMSYHTQLDDLLDDWPGLLAEIKGSNAPIVDRAAVLGVAGQIEVQAAVLRKAAG